MHAHQRRRWSPPAQFEEYRIEQRLGSGSEGDVYLALDTVLERPVTIKFLQSVDATAEARLLSEARTVARIQHPNVLTLYRIGKLEDRPYLVTEYVRGIGLDRLALPVDSDTVLSYAVDLAGGLAAAHRRGVLHRDIKPANAILADSGSVKLLDFGLAIFLEPTDLEAHPENMLAGTPAYMAPEVWRVDEPTPRSDIYSLGVLLYELCTGSLPSQNLPLAQLPQAVQELSPRSVIDVVPEISPAFAAIIHRCLAPDPADRFSSAEELLAALEGIEARPLHAARSENPYRGLCSFDAEHRGVFFGRSTAITAALERLRSDPFLLVTGDSGVGKSSLCQAGILPRLVSGHLRDHRAWSSVRMVPGKQPCLALASAVSRWFDGDERAVYESLLSAPDQFAQQWKRKLLRGGSVALLVDQLEELVTQSDEHEAAMFVSALAPICAGVPGFRLLATTRSDYLTRLGGIGDLGRYFTGAVFVLAPLTRGETREAITAPAALREVRFESDELVEHLVCSTRTGEGGLPLLQFALSELWDARADNTISAATLEEIGGVEGALGRHAERVLNSLAPRQRELARRLVLRLVTAEGTRARASAQELIGSDADAADAIEALIRGRLVLARQGPVTEYEITHEALLATSSTLRRWLDDRAGTHAAQERIAAAALEWERAGRVRQALWHGPRLTDVQGVPPDDLGGRERDFLEASQREHRRKRALKWAMPAVGVAVMACTWAVLALANELRIQRELDGARGRLAAALDARAALRAERRDALRLFGETDAAAAEDKWRHVQGLEKQVEQAMAEAALAFEKTLVLAPHRPEVSEALAGLLFERAITAEEFEGPGSEEQHLQRLRIHDQSGDRARLWAEPARVTISTSAADAVLTLRKLSVDGTPEPERPIAPSDDDLELQPASWLLLARHPDHADVRYPFVVRRGERLSISLTLPPKDSVPAGFVYVPAGSFTYGSADEDTVRQYLNTTPARTVTTGAYLIARHETTFGEWLEFLDSLPPHEARLRTPRGASTSMHGFIAVEQRRGVWWVKMQPGDTLVEAAAGRPLRFGGRKRRVDQDWLKLPVSGVSWKDARAYTHWLSETGRVPGARLCTDYEWERAARGADGRIYPHGNRLSPSDANFDQTYGKQPAAFGPDEVGSYPQSRSPFGIDDLAGNVWEWVSSSAEPTRAVARGGSFYFSSSTLRANNRELPEPTLRDLTVGLRVCASYPADRRVPPEKEPAR